MYAPHILPNMYAAHILSYEIALSYTVWHTYCYISLTFMQETRASVLSKVIGYSSYI